MEIMIEKLTGIAALRYRVREARATGAIGFVPTMGALHEGHLTLVRQARAECKTVVVSIFVNPTQFNDKKDLEKYPRDLERDIALCQEAGAHLVFAPEPEEIYLARARGAYVSHIWNTGGREYFQNKNGRCIDSPCCGCCNI